MAVVLALLGLIMVLISNILVRNISNVRVTNDLMNNRYNANQGLRAIMDELVFVRDSDIDIKLALSGGSIVYAHPYKNYYILDVTTGAGVSTAAGIWFDKENNEPGKIRRGPSGEVLAIDILSLTLNDEVVVEGTTQTGIFIEIEAGKREGSSENIKYNQFISHRQDSL